VTKAKPQPKKAPGRPIVSVRVAENLNDRIAALAKAEGIEVADWLRAALLTEVRRQERSNGRKP
jgi:hypothetical protein